MSFKPKIVKFLSCGKPCGSVGIGFELKSATWRFFKCFISSGMSGISERLEKETHLIKFNKLQYKYIVIYVSEFKRSKIKMVI